jgi:copper(I)-binding protein/uncharacterized protein YcnI
MTMKHLLTPAVLAGLFAMATPASAHIVLSQPAFESGARYAAFFKVEHGCDGSPTTALRVEMPDGVAVLRMPDKPGWKLTSERAGNRITAVTWQGRLDAKAKDQFGLFLQLPKKEGALYFPATQRCEMGETRWVEIPKDGQTWHDVPHPAPMLQLTAAAAPAAGGMVMAGNIMIEQPWARATPPGAPTGAAYLTIVNHGAVPDMLTGATTDAASEVQIHQTSMANGVMSMRPAKTVGIPPGGTVKIAPDGYHLMLVGLKAPLKQGAHIALTLNFARAGKVMVEFPVEAIGAQGPAAAMPGMDHRH